MTGATSGIGLATVIELARAGVTVLAVGGPRTPGTEAEESIRAKVPNARLEMFAVDLANLTDVGRLADQVGSRHGTLHALLNVAGRASAGPSRSNGLDVILATNHLGPFLLTNRLLPLLARGRPSRIITVTSSRHRAVREIPWLDLEQGQSSGRTDMYLVTKLLNVLFTTELSRRFRGDGVTAMAADPGFVRTRLDRDTTGAFRLFLRLTRSFQSDPVTAGKLLARLALETDADYPDGAYVVGGGTVAEPSPLAEDAVAAKRLWELSVSLTGLPHNPGANVGQDDLL